jgi:hypothetical protein
MIGCIRHVSILFLADRNSRRNDRRFLSQHSLSKNVCQRKHRRPRARAQLNQEAEFGTSFAHEWALITPRSERSTLNPYRFLGSFFHLCCGRKCWYEVKGVVINRCRGLFLYAIREALEPLTSLLSEEYIHIGILLYLINLVVAVSHFY